MKSTHFQMVCCVPEKEEQEEDDKANEAKCKQLMSPGKCCKGVAYSSCNSSDVWNYIKIKIIYKSKIQNK